MSMTEWAKREIEFAKNYKKDECCKEDQEYFSLCAESALKAFTSLMEDGHSGLSINVTKRLLDRLIDGLPLTEISGNDDEWEFSYTNSDGDDVYHNIRMSALFKHISKTGEIKYSDVDRDVGVEINDPNNCYHSGLVSRIVDEYSQYQVKMPYYPSGNKIYVYTETFLTDPKNGDFDTQAILYLIDRDKKRIDINRYFKDSDTSDGFEEITKEEYEERKKRKIR